MGLALLPGFGIWSVPLTRGVSARLLDERSVDLATVKKGILVRAGEWWKHLRMTKRSFWKRHRRAEQDSVREDLRMFSREGEEFRKRRFEG